MALSTISKLSNANVWPTNSNNSTHHRSAPPRIRIPAAAQSSGGGLTSEFEEGQLDRPKWTGETPLSRLVAALISFKPLYSVMKLGARQVLISTAEKTNIPWRDMTKEILESDVYKEKDAIEDSSLVYPDYYLNPLYAYDEGNLSWLAAAEAEAATMSMVRRAIPDASSLDEANQIVRGNWLQAIENHHQQYSGSSTIGKILDIGCSVGVSTKFLADKFPSANVTGLDLSPYFLAVAQYNDKKRNEGKQKMRWVHGNGESTGLPSKSFDVVSISYVFHECPERAIKNMAKEAFWLLRPGGTLAITDNSPKSKILQKIKNYKKGDTRREKAKKKREKKKRKKQTNIEDLGKKKKKNPRCLHQFLNSFTTPHLTVFHLEQNHEDRDLEQRTNMNIGCMLECEGFVIKIALLNFLYP